MELSSIWDLLPWLKGWLHPFSLSHAMAIETQSLSIVAEAKNPHRAAPYAHLLHDEKRFPQCQENALDHDAVVSPLPGNRRFTAGCRLKIYIGESGPFKTKYYLWTP